MIRFKLIILNGSKLKHRPKQTGGFMKKISKKGFVEQTMLISAIGIMAVFALFPIVDIAIKGGIIVTAVAICTNMAKTEPKKLHSEPIRICNTQRNDAAVTR